MPKIFRLVPANSDGLATHTYSRVPLLNAFIERCTTRIVVQSIEYVVDPPQITGSVVINVSVYVVDEVKYVKTWVVHKRERDESVHECQMCFAPITFLCPDSEVFACF